MLAFSQVNPSGNFLQVERLISQAGSGIGGYGCVWQAKTYESEEPNQPLAHWTSTISVSFPSDIGASGHSFLNPLFSFFS